MEITFTDPNIMYFLLGVPLLIAAYLYNIKYKKKAALRFSNFEAVSRVFKTSNIVSHNALAFSISLLIFVSLVLAASGSTLWYEGRSSKVDYVIAIDASASMTADDFSPNRLEAAKKAAKQFVDVLPRDARAAVISFSGTSFVEQQLTDDFDAVRETIGKMEISEIAGTDIAGALITATNLLISETRPKVIVLFTDGRSTVGVPIEIAMDYVNNAKIITYTIGMATAEGGKIAGTEAKSTIDEESLREVAYITGGKYYGVSSEKEFENVCSSIIKECAAILEKKKISIRLAPLLLSIILILLIFQWILSFTKYNNLP